MTGLDRESRLTRGIDMNFLSTQKHEKFASVDDGDDDDERSSEV
jgi:hypothetical protein